MSTKFNRKPPLVKSPIRTRPTRAVRYATSVSVHTPPASIRKSAVLIRGQSSNKMDIKFESDSISCDMRALAQMVIGKNETKGMVQTPVAMNNSPLFERGRFYDLYSAKRNEKLRRKLCNETEDENLKKCCGKYDLGVTPETLKRRDSTKMENRRKSLPVDLRTQVPRYSLRSSSKDHTKPVLSMSFNKSCGGADAAVAANGKRNESVRRVVRKI